jgi:hypothetical protein
MKKPEKKLKNLKAFVPPGRATCAACCDSVHMVFMVGNVIAIVEA